MKRNRKVMLMGCMLGLAGLASCTDGYESEPVENFTLDYVFSPTDSVGTQATQYLNNIYRHLVNGHNRVGSDYLDAATDDAISIYYDDSEVYKLAMGRYTPTGRISAEMGWGTYYNTIREASIFVANIDRVPFNLTYVKAGETETDADGNLKETPLNVTMKAEARFLRALAYFELVKRYGGVPLLGDRVFELNDNLELPRNSFAQCVEYIVGELDDIKDDLRGLPMNGSDATNYAAVPTREACMALKTRVLLYAASKLFNEEPLERGNELVGYATYDRNRWKLAADAALELMSTAGHKGSGVINLNPNFRNAFLGYYSGGNTELIWFVQGEMNSYNLERNNGPLGFTGNGLGNGRTLPTQNLVESFPMKDGKPIGSSAYPYEVNNQYANRDPRLAAYIVTDGSTWGHNNSVITTGTYGTNNDAINAEQGHSTRTGYYLRKLLRPDCNADPSVNTTQDHVTTRIRYTEIYLDFAEAANEAWGPTDARKGYSAYDVIKKIRQRAGIGVDGNDPYLESIKNNKDEMRKLIRNERRIELCFEGARFWDLRRWKEDLNNTARGMQISKNGGALKYEVINVESRSYSDYMNYGPIPYGEIVKFNNLVQNDGWK